MEEYISREAVKSALGCGRAVKYGNETLEQRDESYSTLMLYEIADAVDGVPAADVVPVVRCKDCCFYSTRQSFTCDLHNRAADIDDYCSYAARKEA